MRTTKTTILTALFLALGETACGGTGTGPGVRNDVTKQVSTIQSAAAACYKDALHERSRRIRGRLVIGFEIEPKTGQFGNAMIMRSQVGDPALEECVLEEVNKLKLEKPQKTKVTVDFFPIDFVPVDPSDA